MKEAASTLRLRCEEASFTKNKKKFIQFAHKNGATIMETSHPNHLLRLKCAKGKTSLVTLAPRQRKVIFQGFSSQLWRDFSRQNPHNNQRLNLSKRLYDLYIKDNGTCFYCLKPVTPSEASVEHLIAVSRGGTNCSDNLTLAHKRCNGDQADKPLLEKLAFREANLVLQQMKTYKDLYAYT